MNAYFDTSALVKLLVLNEPGAGLAKAIWDEAERVSSSQLTYVETRAAMAAAARGGRMTPGAWRHGRLALDGVFDTVTVAELTPGLIHAAADLADEHGLRGYDAVHLASSLSLATDGIVMVTWDRELAVAAHASGLDVAGIDFEVP